MPAYAYAININRDKKTIHEDKEEIIEGPLSIAKLSPVVGDNSFTVSERDWQDGGGYLITIHIKRLETDIELAARVAKEERYMEEYNRRNGKS